MGFYIRVLGLKDPDIHLDAILEDLYASGLNATFAVLEGQTADNWSTIQVSNEAGEVFAEIERSPVLEGQLGFDELNEFREVLVDYKPQSSVNWLNSYFDKIRVIYAIKVFDDTFTTENYTVIAAIKETIWNLTGGILQADNEGFSNEDGYHILWQFSDSIKGTWHMALLDTQGNWTRFQMDVGDRAQRREFKNGVIPMKAVRL